MTRLGRVLTAKGVKPIGPFQQRFKNSYLYGLISPGVGDSFFMSADKTDTFFFQYFLDQFSLHNPETYKIIFMDRAAYHTTKKLTLPPNICLCRIPAYCPELNPMERFWQDLKAAIAWRNFKTQPELEQWLETKLMSYSKTYLASLTAYPHILKAKAQASSYALS